MIGGRPGRPGGSGRPNRPIIGGGNNNNINIGNNVGNRPGYGRPGWGYGRPGRPGYGGNWSRDWHDHHVHHHHGWYNGCWSGHWGNRWYAPLAYGAVGWGLGAWTSGWGYPFGYSYSNPYYVSTTSTPVYDYSQPIVVNDYSTVNESSTTLSSDPAPPPETSAEQAAYELSDQALASFKAGNYSAAAAQLQQAIVSLPNDPVLHEVLALTMFATAQYGPAAAILNNLLAVAPGMDWTTLSGLYGNTADYEKQLDALANYCVSHPTDAASHFVLAYHRLVCGDPDDAVDALKVVVQQQPKDQVARQMLESLSPDDSVAADAVPPNPEDSARRTASSNDAAPTTDLVGSWQAKRDDARFLLTLNDDSNFSWKSETTGQETIELNGTYTVANDMLILDSAEQGAMVGRAVSKDADRFAFVPVDAPSNDPGLDFGRLR